MPTPFEDDQTALFNKGKEQLRSILECLNPDPSEREKYEAQINKFGTFNDADHVDGEEHSDPNPDIPSSPLSES